MNDEAPGINGQTFKIVLDKSFKNDCVIPSPYQMLKSQFSEEFFEEFQFDAEFRTLFQCMDTDKLSPYQAIEYLCESKKKIYDMLVEALQNKSNKIILSSEQFENLKNNIYETF